jgi:hypothetical protein
MADADSCGRNQSTRKCSTSSNGMNYTKLPESGPRKAARLVRWKMRLWAIASARASIMEAYARTIPSTWLGGWISTSESICWRVNSQGWSVNCIRQSTHPGTSRWLVMVLRCFRLVLRCSRRRTAYRRYKSLYHNWLMG